MKFQSDAQKECYDDFLKSPVWNVIQESARRPTSSDLISTNIAQKVLKFGTEIQHDVFSNGFFLDPKVEIVTRGTSYKFALLN